MSERQATSLARRLGPFDAAAIVVSNVIGSGIFFVPILVAQFVTDPTAILLVWLAGGLLSFAGAMAYAELAALRPRAGGEYVYLREAFGPLVGFLSGWTSFVAGFSGAIAAGAVALAEYLGRFVPAAADATPLFVLPVPFVALAVSRKSIVALGVVTGLTIVHLRGLGPGVLVQNLLASTKVLAIVLFIVLGFSIGRHEAIAAGTGDAAAFGPVAFLLALVPVMFTYSGWNAATYVAEEVRAPERNVPLALGLGTTAVVAIYMGLNALYLHALPAPVLASTTGTLIDTVTDRLFGGAGRAVAAFAVVSIAASVSAMTLAGPRVYFAMARDGLFPRAASRIHPRFQVPAVAIVAQSLWSGVLILSGTLAQLVSYTGFAILLFSGMAVAAVFVLRRRASDGPATFRTWGYPLAPALFVVACLVIVVNELRSHPGTALAGVAIIAMGIPVYWMLKTKN